METKVRTKIILTFHNANNQQHIHCSSLVQFVECIRCVCVLCSACVVRCCPLANLAIEAWAELAVGPVDWPSAAVTGAALSCL